ncbi:MAG: hypothetical protein K2N56_03410 [Oscillospiraceae bacterium]|nr:hypothetical protein [Oscillospiraceae bacterium]
MAFENAYLTEEEKEMFVEAHILDPGDWKSSILIPHQWTIDRKNNIALIYCGVPDREEYWKKSFVLFYKGIDSRHMIELIIEDSRTWFGNRTNDEVKKQIGKKLISHFDAEVVRRYLVHKIYRIDKTTSIETIANVLADALSAYGVNGNPDHAHDAHAFKAIVEVNGEAYYGNV